VKLDSDSADSQSPGFGFSGFSVPQIRIQRILDAALDSDSVPAARGESGGGSRWGPQPLLSNVAALRLGLSRLARLGVPQSVMDVLSPKALTTMPNERFHIGQRLHSPMPSALEWARIRARNIRDEAAFVAAGGFSDWHGERRSRTLSRLSCEPCCAASVPVGEAFRK
jgi:hypothetical protein